MSGSRSPPSPAAASSPPRWEIGLYAAGALALLGIAAINLWKLWRSGSYPAPSPFPNYDYRYLEQKYGAACPDIRSKVRGEGGLVSFPLQHAGRWRGGNLSWIPSRRGTGAGSDPVLLELLGRSLELGAAGSSGLAAAAA